MDFLIRKFLSVALMPLSFAILIGIIGLLILWFSSWRKTASVIITFSFVILLAFSTGFVPDRLLGHLESRYKPLFTAPTNVHKIVVLGGGVGGQVGYPPNTRINSASLSRLIEGIRLYRQLTRKGVHVELLLSGGRIYRNPKSEAARMRNTAVMLGVKPKDIQIENGSKDTYQEALYLNALLGKKPFILVTSAYHMPRAIALFKHLGMKPIPAPTQYIVKLNRNPFKHFLPSMINLTFSDIALHEYLGLTYAKWKHRIA